MLSSPMDSLAAWPAQRTHFGAIGPTPPPTVHDPGSLLFHSKTPLPTTFFSEITLNGYNASTKKSTGYSKKQQQQPASVNLTVTQMHPSVMFLWRNGCQIESSISGQTFPPADKQALDSVIVYQERAGVKFAA